MMTSYVKLVRLKIKLTNWYKKTKGAIIRSRARYTWGKNTKYFLNMEKRQFSAKVIYRLKLENNHVITDPDLILNEENNFYEKLYSAEHKKT